MGPCSGDGSHQGREPSSNPLKQLLRKTLTREVQGELPMELRKRAPLDEEGNVGDGASHAKS
jgi:hypothetical protein